MASTIIPSSPTIAEMQGAIMQVAARIITAWRAIGADGAEVWLLAPTCDVGITSDHALCDISVILPGKRAKDARIVLSLHQTGYAAPTLMQCSATPAELTVILAALRNAVAADGTLILTAANSEVAA